MHDGGFAGYVHGRTGLNWSISFCSSSPFLSLSPPNHLSLSHWSPFYIHLFWQQIFYLMSSKQNPSSHPIILGFREGYSDLK